MISLLVLRVILRFFAEDEADRAAPFARLVGVTTEAEGVEFFRGVELLVFDRLDEDGVLGVLAFPESRF